MRKNTIENTTFDLSLGIDIGTTTISASVVSVSDGKQIDSFTVQNDSAIAVKEKYKKEQDALKIFSIVKDLLTVILTKYDTVRKIGVTGQMHGVLYVDKNGKAVSPLYTWQDGRADIVCGEGRTYAQEITFMTGRSISSGYGVATHYYNVKNGLVPPAADKLCSIGDYIAMRLTGTNAMKIDATNAASLGLFDVKENRFDANAFERLGLETYILPEVAETNDLIGYYLNIPVYVAIGDNQASFFGAVANEQKGVLVNYGTGSQISFVSGVFNEIDGFEIRPYRDGEYLYSGAAICGGRAYAVLEKFFSDYLTAFGTEHGKQYEIMNELARKACKDRTDLVMETTFCGKRNDPKKTGGLYNIREDNFTPENVVYATLVGMATELADGFDKTDKSRFSTLIASGNAVRKNEVLQSVLSSVFKMPLLLPTVNEEAAYGVALWICVPPFDDKTKTGIKKDIRYIKGAVI